MDSDFFDRVSDSLTLDHLQRVGTDYYSSHGATMISYHHYPPIGAVDYKPIVPIYTLGFPEAWVDAYVAKNYMQIDPIVRKAMTSTQAFWWSDIATLQKLTPREEDYIAAMKDADLGDGLALPVYGPHGRDGYFGIGFGSSAPELSTFRMNQIHWAGQTIHLKCCEIAGQRLPTPKALSLREKSTMRRVAQGWTNAEIAEAMNVSEKTVRTYLARSFDKLNVHDRMTAALRALSAGLLD